MFSVLQVQLIPLLLSLLSLALRATSSLAMASTTPTQEPSDPDEYIATSRRSILESVLSIQSNKDDVQLDIQQNVREIRAILQTNAEIFDRCMPLAIDHIIDEENKSSRTLFVRNEITEVFTRHETVYRGNYMTRFLVHPTQFDKSFDTSVLTNIPESLQLTIGASYKSEPYHMYIDFELLLKRSSILHEDALALLLVHLKSHLMVVQVCLGQIDEWLMAPNETYCFLESAFQTPFNAIMMKGLNQTSSKCNCDDFTHDKELKCKSCNRAHKEHCDNRGCPGMRQPTYRYESDQFWFHCQQPEEYVIKDFVDDGQYVAKFDVSNEHGRKKLYKLVELLSA